MRRILIDLRDRFSATIRVAGNWYRQASRVIVCILLAVRSTFVGGLAAASPHDQLCHGVGLFFVVFLVRLFSVEYISEQCCVVVNAFVREVRDC